MSGVGPLREHLPGPFKVYCLWCGRESYGLTMVCGACLRQGRTEEEWFRA